MVTSYGMSPELGNVDLASNYERLSAQTKQTIEAEVRRLIEEGRERATKLLISKRKELDYLAQALLDYETLNKDEAFKVIKGEKLEGRLITAGGPVKIPHVGPGTVPELPKIPGSATPTDKEPPRGSGGVVA